MRPLTPDDPEYPQPLLDRPSPPKVLWVDGPPLSRARAVAIVGSREPSLAAARFAEDLGERIASRGTTVVSGGAPGIDSAAHRGACKAGPTWVVLPCGLEKAGKVELHDRVKASGGALLSTFDPTLPPTLPKYHTRNTTITRLVTDMVVVQAAANSGSLSVGRKGLSLGVRVFTFRGPCWDPLFAGTAELLRTGAVEPASVESLIEALVQPPPRRLSHDEAAVVQSLRNDPIHLDDLSEATSLPIGRVSSALLTLALDNVVVEGPAGCFRRNST